MKKFIFTITLIELGIVFLLSANIINKKLGGYTFGRKTEISSINKENVVFPQGTELKYFYEPEANKEIEVHEPWMKSPIHYTINADALNEREDYLPEKSDKVYRIIALGDSFTYGRNVNTGDNWTERLEDKLNTELSCGNIIKFEVINLAMEGYDIQYIVHRFKTRGLKYDPDLVIWFEIGSGFGRLHEEMFPLINACKADPDLRELDEKSFWTYCFDQASLELRKNIPEDELTKRFNNYWTDFLSINKTQTKIVFATFTELNEHDKNKIATVIQQRPNSFLYDGIKPLGSKVLTDGHPDPKGHISIASDLFTYIKDSIAVCNSE